MMERQRKKAMIEGAKRKLNRAFKEGMDLIHTAVDQSLDNIIQSPPGPSAASQGGGGVQRTLEDLALVSRARALGQGPSRKASAKVNPRSDIVTLSMVKMVATRKSGYRRNGNYVEVGLAATDSYEEVITRAIRLIDFDVELEEGDGTEFALMRANGTLIPNNPLTIADQQLQWTICNYLRSIGRQPSQVKLGIGLLAKTETAKRQNKSSSSHELPEAKKPKISTNVQAVEVAYSPYIGGMGLDMKVVSRLEVFKRDNEDLVEDDESLSKMMNFSPPFHPERSHYMVSSISKGDLHLLKWNDHNGWTVLGDSKSDPFRIVHQSSSKLVLPASSEDDVAIPLYAIASQHNFDYKYTWSDAVEHVGANSPVLWVSTPGLYSCTVRRHVTIEEQCKSMTIEVSREDNSAEGSHNVPVQSKPTEQVASTTRRQGSTTEYDPDGSSVQLVEGPGSKHSNRSEGSCSSGIVKQFHKEEISDITNNFAEEKLIGKGGFGRVFRGSYHHLEVAVKLLSEHGIQALKFSERPLEHEVELLTRLRHPNLISLMGYCPEPAAMVYPFMERLSLYHNLHRWKVTNPLTWNQRVSILEDTARGLTYLHMDSPPFIHQDIKSANILLDVNLTAKLADFGFSIQLPKEVGSTTLMTAPMVLAGTKGYLPPEFMMGKYGVKGDVYSYGVVVLETFSGLLPYSEEREEENLVEYCEDGLSNLETFARYADVKAGTSTEQITKQFHTVATACLQKYRKRASIDVVLMMWQTYQKKPVDSDTSAE